MDQPAAHPSESWNVAGNTASGKWQEQHFRNTALGILAPNSGNGKIDLSGCLVCYHQSTSEEKNLGYLSYLKNFSMFQPIPFDLAIRKRHAFNVYLGEMDACQAFLVRDKLLGRLDELTKFGSTNPAQTKQPPREDSSSPFLLHVPVQLRCNLVQFLRRLTERFISQRTLRRVLFPPFRVALRG